MSEFLIGEKMIIISRGRRKTSEARKGRGIWPILWMILIILFLMGVDANIRSVTTNYKYRVTDSNMVLEKFNDRKNKLSAEVESLRNPRRIEKIALKRLGMKEPDSGRVYGER
jgi:cell division protein FtsL